MRLNGPLPAGIVYAGSYYGGAPIGAAVANVWCLPGPFLVFRGRVIPLEWTGPAEHLDPLMHGKIMVPKEWLVRDPWRGVLAHAGGQGALRELADAILQAQGKEAVFASAQGFASAMSRVSQ